MRHALAVRLRRAPLHERRELRVPLGAVDERLLRGLGRRVAEDLPQRRLGLRRRRGRSAGTARRASSRRCSTHCRSSTAASVPLMSPTRYGVSGVARSRVATFWNPYPFSQTIDSVADDRGGHARNAALLPQGLEVALEDGKRAGRRERATAAAARTRPVTASSEDGRPAAASRVRWYAVHGAIA